MVSSWNNAPYCRECFDSIKLLPVEHCCYSCSVPIPGLKYVPVQPDQISEEKIRPRCFQCTVKRPFFEHIRAAGLYQKSGPLRNGILALKHSRNTSLLRPFTNLLEETYKNDPFFQRIDLLVPVPLHWSRFVRRGFNQSTFLAQKLSRRIGIPYHVSLLKRKKQTPPQHGDRTNRTKNVAKAFSLTKKEVITDQRILLVDDVITTGATLDECSRVLMENGAEAVFGIAVARVIP